MSFYNLLFMPMSELLEFLEGQPDFVGEAVAKAAYQELTRGLYAGK